MKIGNLVRVNRKTGWVSKEDWSVTGLVVRVLSKNCYRKNTAYEVLWDSNIKGQLPVWHSDLSIEVINGE